MKLILGERFKVINSNIKVSSKRLLTQDFNLNFQK